MCCVTTPKSCGSDRGVRRYRTLQLICLQVLKMPEAPELHLAARYINTVCNGLIFSGPVEKSEVSKNPEVSFNSQGYAISATSRGKEVKLSLTPIKVEKSHLKGGTQKAGGTGKENSPIDIVFRFGMSGCFTLTPVDEMPKHAHLRFYTNENPRRVLSFVDVRRFGSWVVPGIWQSNRGPCVMLEYEKFRENVIRNLQNKAFDKPICEALLNQKYFNGIGNYLRAEILFRSNIPPFVKARTVLEPLEYTDELTLSKKLKLKKENPDLLDFCNLLPFEVVNLEEKGSNPKLSDSYAGLQKWVQCYYVPGMKTLLDSNKRAIWFQGDPGPMAPKGAKIYKKSVSLVKADPDAMHVKETTSKRKKANGTSANSVASNKTTPRKKAKESAKKLSSSATRKKGSSRQDPKAPHSRGGGQQPRRGAKTSAVKYSPRNTLLVKGRRGQKLSKEGDPGVKISVNSQQKVKNEEEPAAVTKTPLKKSQHERVRKLKKEEILSPPPGGSLKSTLLAKGRKPRASAQKSTGSPRGTGRNPRRVKAK